MKNNFHYIFLCSVFLSVILLPAHVKAQQSGDVFAKNQQRLSLAKSFISKLKPKLDSVDRRLRVIDVINDRNILSDGEVLLLQPVLARNFRLDGVIMGIVNNGKILLSIRDISDVLQLPISIDIDNKAASGWYVREEKPFHLDLNNKIMLSDIGEFIVSDDVIIKDNDIWAPAYELGQWIDFEFKPVISSMDLKIESSELLPVQKRYNRRNLKFTKYGAGNAKLPRGGETYTAIGAPSVDIATASTYRKRGGDDEKGIAKHSVNIRTSGDLAYGTLTTQSRINNDNQLTSVRVNYKQESDEANLLGSLKARRFEAGDIITTRVPLGGQVVQEMGLRVTNTDSLRTFTVPTTGISGTAFAGWDVELYRDNQLVGFREVGEDGFYNFEDVDLYMADNNFKLIFYGPQGEIREENLFVPVNQSLSRGDGAYDVSISLDKENAYNKKIGSAQDPDKGSVNIAAYYEKPIMDGTTISAGLWSSEYESERNSAANIGFSTILAQTLVNGGLAVDDEGDMSGELSFRKDFGEHKFRDTINWNSSGFDTQSGGGQNSIGGFSNNLSVFGPLPWGSVNKQRYNAGVNYFQNTEGNYSINARAGISSSIKNVSFSEQLQYRTGSNAEADSLSSFTNVTANIGKNRLRIGADYSFAPDSELKSILATYRRNFTKKVNIELGITKTPQQSLTQYSAKMDWQAGFMRISPSIKYDSKKDFFAGLNTRFGLLRDPSKGRVNMYDSNLTNVGAVSAFVYLDKDGNGKFDGDDEPLKDIVVKAPQNGGRKQTDENGVALFNRMGRLKLTDILLDVETLQDPTWVSSFEGVSILPREGYVAEVSFPIHISGEIDGSVYARAVALPDNSSDVIDIIEPKPIPLRNINLRLYNDKGMVENSVVTDATGFYYFPKVQPGRYFLIIDEESASSGRFIRPEPQQIEIGYSGDIIYGNNLYVDMGDGDIPSAFLPNLDDYKARHPHIDFSNKNNDLVLNLGEFNSRLLMSVVWYKIRSRYGDILAGAELFVPPARSYASIKTGKHSLRVGLNDKTLDSAYARCKALIARNQYCKVEIYPSYIKQAKVKNANID